MNKTAVIYARVSSEEQTSNYSLPTQIDGCQDYAAKHGFEVVGTYSDSYTGTLLERPQLKQVKQLAGQVGAVIVYTQDRLGRAEALDTWNLIAEFDHKGTQVHCADRGIVNITDFFGQLEMLFRARSAKEESLKIGERTSRGKKARARAGKVVGTTAIPYGYTYDPVIGMFVINEDEAQYVRLMFHWYVYGDESGKRLGCNALAVKLTKLGIPTKYDGEKRSKSKRAPGVWGHSSVVKILHNETYTGVWYFNQTKLNANRKTKTPKDRSEWIPVSVPAIISRDLWDSAQRQMNVSSDQAKRNTKFEYLMRGRMVCATCGYAFACKSDYRTIPHRWHRYVCHGTERAYSPDGNTITCHWALRQQETDDMVWETVLEALKKPRLILRGMKEQHAQKEAQLQPDRDYLARCQEKRAKCESHRQRLLKLYLDGRYDKDWLDNGMAMIKKEEAELTDKIRDLEERIAEVEISRNDIAEIQAFCKRVKKGLDHATFEEKCMVLDKLRIKAVVQRGKTMEEDVIMLSGYIPTIRAGDTFASNQSRSGDVAC